MGIKKEIREHVFTSGEAALRYLKKNLLNKKFFHVGPSKDFDLFKDLKNLKLKEINDCEYILCTGLFENYDEDLVYYKKLFEKHLITFLIILKILVPMVEGSHVQEKEYKTKIVQKLGTFSCLINPPD